MQMGLNHGNRCLPERSVSASIPARSAKPAQEPADIMGSVTNSAGRRILVIEDEVLIGMLLEDMLIDLGYGVVGVVPKLKDALAAVQRESFDLAILDVHLHGESVFPVADVLMARGVPFVFATGYGERGLPEAYRGRPVLQKPFAKADLERVLKSMFT